MTYASYTDFNNIQTHDSQKTKIRCFLKRSTDSQLVCRFPLSQPTNSVLLRPIPQHLSEETYYSRKAAVGQSQMGRF